jgi:hypothetical protein
LGRRILLDSNVWRYIIDAGALPDLQRAARKSRHVIVASPAVLFEAAHADDRKLRDRLLTAMTKPAWKRLMPEAYWEAEELKGEVRRLRPEWLRPSPDLMLFRRVKHDWVRAKGGVWDRIGQEAHLLQQHDAEMLDRAREQAYALREDARNLPTTWESTPLSMTLCKLSVDTPGWNGSPVEPWRIDALNVFTVAINTVGHPSKDWLAGELDFQFMMFQSEQLTRFWLHEVDLLSMRRHWLRWAFEFLQRLRRVTDGTPVDAQLGTYLIDTDLLVSADKNLIWMASRCQIDAPFTVATPVKVPAGEGAADEVIRLLSSHS